jgi:hypothetical protein
MSITVKKCPKCGCHYSECVGCPNGCAAELAEPALHIPQQPQAEIAAEMLEYAARALAAGEGCDPGVVRRWARQLSAVR